MTRSASQAADVRIDWVDYARGLGIFLVVLGHTERGLVNSGILPRTSDWQFLDDWIYAFHMPLFFFLAGLFFTRSAERGTGHFLADKLRTVAYPYAIWSIVQSLVQIGMGRYTNNPTSWQTLTEVVYQPPMQFWFLYALFVGFLVFQCLFLMGVRSWGFVVVALILLAVEHFYGVGPWGVLHQTVAHLPYLALGVAMSRVLMSRALGLAGAGTVTLLGFGSLTVLVWWHKAEGWLQLPCALLGIGALVALSQALARLSRPQFLKRWGALSLQIYVAHTIVSAGLRIILHRCAGVTNPWVHLVGGVLIGMYAPIAVNLAAQRMGCRWLFTLPKRATHQDGKGSRKKGQIHCPDALLIVRGPAPGEEVSGVALPNPLKQPIPASWLWR